MFFSNAKRRGFDLGHLRARQVNVADYEHYDYILAMDRQNLLDLRNLRPSNYTGVLGLFLEEAGLEEADIGKGLAELTGWELA